MEVELPVDVDVETTTEIVCDGIDHDVEDDGRENPFSLDDGEIRLSLPTQAHRSLSIITA